MLARQTDEADAAAAGWLVAAGEPQRAAEIRLRLARRALTGGGLRTAEDLLRQAEAYASPAAVAILQVERLTLEGRVDEALDLGVAALDAARFDEHAELCLQLARAAVTAGRVGESRRVRHPRRATRAGPVVDPARRLRPRGRSGGRGRPTGRRRGHRRPRRVRRAALRGALRARADPPAHRRRPSPAPASAPRLRSRANTDSSPGGSRRCSVSARSSCWRTRSSPTLLTAQQAAVEIGLLGQAGQAEILLADHALVCRRSAGPGRARRRRWPRPAPCCVCRSSPLSARCCWPPGTP